MTIYVFTGPTLSPEDAQRELDAVYLPPVSQGDVYRVARTGPRAIGIIDGYFERVPAVWHKEILWAMSRGIHVYGSASMGALRAAELAPFGMEGVGKVFEAYCDGSLADDDEVAVAHGLAESGYRCLSEAMVNIRGTLAAAEAQGVLQETTRTALERIAKSLFYPERSYPRILKLGATQGLAAAELDALRDWLRNGRVDQKREDAQRMLRTMRERLAVDGEPKRIDYRLEHTVYWDNAMREAGAAGGQMGGELTMLPTDAILDELRLLGGTYFQVADKARLRDLALREARHQGYRASREARQNKAEQFRQTHGLHRPEDVHRWLNENHVSPGRFEDLIDEEVLVDLVRTTSDAPETLLDQLRVTGAYSALQARAQEKQRMLSAAGLDYASLQEVGLTLEALLDWCFGRLGPSIVADLRGYARSYGFDSVDRFLRSVLREYCYVRMKDGTRPCPPSGLSPS